MALSSFGNKLQERTGVAVSLVALVEARALPSSRRWFCGALADTPASDPSPPQAEAGDRSAGRDELSDESVDAMLRRMLRSVSASSGHSSAQQRRQRTSIRRI